jgi:pSer/pThr/pTyr-binding forkhead associated (FHA) protein
VLLGNRYGFEMTFGDAERPPSPASPSQRAPASSSPAPSQAPGLHLEVIAGNAAGTVIHVEDELVIGRHATGAGQLSEDSEISRQHARITREASGDYAIEDLGSANGTFVNGLKIASPQLLAEGDSIEVGATTLLVRSILGATAPAATQTPPTAPGYAPTIFARAPAPEDAAPIGRRATEVPLPRPQTPPLKLKLEVDFEAREASIALGDDGDAVRLILEDGRWQTPRPRA